MALANAVQGATRPSQIITWTRSDDTAEDLTNATLTGRIRTSDTGATRDIVGALTVVSAAGGVFSWAYDVADVADAGQFAVQFTASFGAIPTPARTIDELWTVYRAL